MPETIHNPVQKDSVTFLETAGESDRTLLEVDLAPGGGNRLHRHLTYTERFEVLEGTLTVQIGRQKLRLAPGETATAPVKSRHAFSNETGEPVRFLVELTPGHAGFEQALRIGYGLAADGETTRDGIPKRLPDMAVLAQMSDIRVCGPLATLTPLLGLIARRSPARRSELLARYGQDTYAAKPALRTAGT
jgi:mannose-6-phosphate isomerase-like protein (cupin superfamily)